MKSFYTLIFATIVACAMAFVPSTGRMALAQRHGWTNSPRSNNQVVAFLLPEEEPTEFFMSNQEKLSPAERMKDPLVLLGLGSIFVPFIMLGVAYAAGWVGQ